MMVPLKFMRLIYFLFGIVTAALNQVIFEGQAVIPTLVTIKFPIWAKLSVYMTASYGFVRKNFLKNISS